MKNETASPATQVDRRKAWAGHLAKLTLSLLLLGYVLSRVDVGAMLDHMYEVPWWVLGATLALNLLAVVFFQSLVNFYSSPPANRIAIRDFCADNMSISFYTLFLPAGLTFLIRWKKYTERGLDGFSSAAQVIFQKILQIWTSAIFMLAGLLALMAAAPTALKALLPMAFGFVVVSTCVVAMFMFGASITRRLSARLDRERIASSGKVAKAGNFLVRAGRKIADACTEIQVLPGGRKYLVVLYACLQQLAVVLGAWVIVNALHPGASFLAMMLVRSVTVLLMLLPVSVAGIGFREASFVALLPLFGISQEVALASSLLLFANTIVLGLIGGLFELPRRKKQS